MDYKDLLHHLALVAGFLRLALAVCHWVYLMLEVSLCADDTYVPARATNQCMPLTRAEI